MKRLVAAVAIASVACRGPLAVVHELSPSENGSRAPQAVEMYRNAPPSRTFVTRAIIDLNVAPSSEVETLARYREVGGRIGCDAVLVFTKEHPVAQSVPHDENLALVIGMDGVVAWRAIGVTSRNRRAFFVETKPHDTLSSDDPTVGFCLSYVR